MFTLRDACRYSLIPHQLGFCGPRKDCSKEFIDFVEGRISDKKKIKNILKRFKAVYFYCQRIAKMNGINDPLNERVLEAYWIGNSLLKKAQYKKGFFPHHSYHVWQRKPFNPKIKLTDKMKKICQVSVKKVRDNYYSYHWKKRIQKLDKKQVENLRYYNRVNKKG